MWTASAVSATRIRRKMGGPWLDDGPRDEDSIGVVPKTELVPAPATEGGARLGAGSVSAFLGAAIILEGLRWILFSNCSFC